MNIIKATNNDIPQIEKLLYQVHKVHSDKRPDLFKVGSKKYSKQQIEDIIKNENTPVYVYKQNDVVMGYAFVIYLSASADSLVQIKTMYIDDFCVSYENKHQGIGSKMFADLQVIAKQNNCYNILLNVYNFNDVAYKFYKKQGMHELKTYMEKIVE